MLDARVIEHQLEPVLGQERATLIASLAAGIENAISENAFGRELLAVHMFPALAAVYGTALGHAQTTLDDTGEAAAAAAAKTLAEMAVIVAATRVPLPAPSPRDLMAEFHKAFEEERARAACVAGRGVANDDDEQDDGA